jgi:putative ATP-dependent endonuclease of OLD family
MLFCKGVLFVEGIAEQLLIPAFTEYIAACDLEKYHVAVINVGGSTFKHFLPLFGAGTQTGVTHLQCRVSCITDGDPKRKQKNQDKARYQNCYPYQIGLDDDKYESQPISGVVANLEKKVNGINNIYVTHGSKTLEYDLAYTNSNCDLLITDSCTNKSDIQALGQNFDLNGVVAQKLLSDDVIEDLKRLNTIEEQSKSAFATAYVESIETSKGEHALDLASALRANAGKAEKERIKFVIPEHIVNAVMWACGKEKGGKNDKTSANDHQRQ